MEEDYVMIPGSGTASSPEGGALGKKINFSFSRKKSSPFSGELAMPTGID